MMQVKMNPTIKEIIKYASAKSSRTGKTVPLIGIGKNGKEITHRINNKTVILRELR